MSSRCEGESDENAELASCSQAALHDLYHVEEDRFIITHERNPSRKSKNARPSGRLVFVSIFARGRVYRRCSRQGMVQLIDAGRIRKHPQVAPSPLSRRPSCPPCTTSTPQPRNEDRQELGDYTFATVATSAIAVEPDASRITPRTPPASPRSSSRTTASTGDCTRPPSPRRPPSPPRRQLPAPCAAARRARRLPPGAGSR